MSTLLTALSLGLILLVVLVVFLPAWLERQARHNRTQQAQLQADLAAARRESNRLQKMLAAVSRTQSTAYRNAFRAAADKVRPLELQWAATADLLARLQSPRPFSYLLPIQHFLTFPQDIGAILADTRLLRRIRTHLKVGAAALTSAGAAVAELAALPTRLAGDQAAQQARLQAILARLEGERRAGITAPVAFVERLTQTDRLLTQAAAIPADAPIAKWDGGALILERSAALLGDLETQTAALVAEREALDERILAVAAALDDAQADTKAGPAAADAPPQVGPLLRHAAELLNEKAAQQRASRDFDAAATTLNTATQYIAVGRDLAVADRRGRLLAARDDGESLTELIAALRHEMDTLLFRLDGPGGLGEVDAELVEQVAGLRGRTEVLVERQNGVIAALEQEAAAVADRVNQAWDKSRRYLQLDEDDPLARRYTRLAAAYAAARRTPAALAGFRTEADAFEHTLAPWLARLEESRQRIERGRTSLPELIDTAQAAAGPWHCLREHVAFIQQRAADFGRVHPHFAKTTRRRDAERVMDELEAIEREVGERLAVLKEQAGRLKFLEMDVRQIMALAGAERGSAAGGGAAELSRRERTLQLIDHHLGQAHAAARYEDAALALARAADLANKLAIVEPGPGM